MVAKVQQDVKKMTKANMLMAGIEYSGTRMIHNNLLNLDWLFESEYWNGPDMSQFEIINLSDGVGDRIQKTLDTYKPNGKKIIFVRPHEIYTPEALLIMLHDFINKHDIQDATMIVNKYYNKKAIHLLPKMKFIDCDYFVLYTEFLHRTHGQKHNNVFDPNAKKDLRFVIGKPDKPNRANLLIEAHSKELLDNSYASILCDDSYINQLAFTTMFNDEYSANVLKKYNKSIDGAEYIQSNNLNLHCQGFPYDETKFTESKASLIPETLSHGLVFVTEKTYYAILNRHPFVIASSTGILQELKNMGYKTFDTVIDESYDLCRDFSRRLTMVIRSTKELLENIHDPQINDILEHNYTVFKAHVDTEINWLEEQIGNI